MSKQEEIIEQNNEEKEIRGIRVGKDFVLYNDPMNLVLEQYGIKTNPREKDLTKQKSYGLINKTFHRTLQQAFNHIIEQTTYDFDFGDLDNVNKQLVELKKMVQEFKNCTKLKLDTLSVII